TRSKRDWSSDVCSSDLVPVSFRHRMSLRPSPLKSPVAATCQSVGTLTAELAQLEPKPPLALPSQSVSVPPSSRHKMSLRPSPLKIGRASCRERVGVHVV